MSDTNQSLLDLTGSEGPSGLEMQADRRSLLASGWIPPDQVSGLIAAIGQIAAGDYMGVPPGKDPLGNALRDLARTLGRANSKRLQDCVNLSIKNNQNLETAVGIFRDIRSIGDQSQTIAAAAEELVSSVETIAQNSTAVAEQARSALDDAKAGASQAERATECMERIASFASGAAGQVARLGDATASIGQIVSTIEEIAFHTNMIALNAAVEAARAGEAGKGFMVVADEVKRLAKQTKEATVDITHRIQSLVADMDGIVESMKVVDSVVAEGRSAINETGRRVNVISRSTRDVTERISEVAEIIHQQQAAATDVAHGITVVATETESIRERIAGVLEVLDETDAIVSKDLDIVAGMSLPNKVIYLAKSDHVKWKKNIAAMLVGRTRMEEGGLADHHSCRLGRWYDQVDDPRLLAAPSFAELEGPHRTVHAVGKDIVRMYNQGDVDGAERGMVRLTEASHQVLELLERLRIESRPRSGEA